MQTIKYPLFDLRTSAANVSGDGSSGRDLAARACVRYFEPGGARDDVNVISRFGE